MAVQISDQDARMLYDKLPAILRCANDNGTRFLNSKRLLWLFHRRLGRKMTNPKT